MKLASEHNRNAGRTGVLAPLRLVSPRVLGGALFVVLSATGCRQDMYNQPRYKPLTPSEFFEDGTSARPLLPNVIPRGQLREDDLLYQGKMPDGKLAVAIPVPVTKELLTRGQERYNIFCSVCHGLTGQGNGMIVMRGFPPPNSYHSDRLRNAPPGYYFDIITNGYGVMYPYSYRLPDVRDRWAIVAYIRALQLSRHATPADVPAEERAKLEGSRPPSP